jgi:hypothetical protein
MKMNMKGRIVLFSLTTIILVLFFSIYHIQITHAGSCCGSGGGPAVAVGAAAPAVSPGVSAGLSFNSIEVEFCDLNQQKELLVNRVDRVESLLANVLSEDPIIWVIM